MRVGIDYRPALHDGGATGRYVRELVRALVELGFDADLGLFGYSSARARFGTEQLGLAGSRAQLVRLPVPSRWLAGLMRRLDRTADDLVGGADVFHHTHASTLAVRRAVEVATISDCTFVLKGSGYRPDELAERMTVAVREQVARAKRILVPSQYVGAEAVMALGAHPARVAVVQLGCDHIARQLPPGGFERPAEPYVLTVARVDPRKNHLRMLEAFELLVKEGLPQRWVVAGSRGYQSDVFAHALEQSPARARVQWIVDAPERDLARLYSQADAFLFASLHEGFGLPPLEAMVCGTPVVTSCVTAMPEICGDAAFLVEPTESERIFEALRRVLVEPDLADELRRRGRQNARKYTWRECAKHTLLAYRNALDRDETPPKLRHTL